MKKLNFLLVSAFLLVFLYACSSSDNNNNSSNDNSSSGDENKPVELKVGASSVPHAELLEHLAEDLEKDGVKLNIEIVNDGVQTNRATNDGDLDLNFFQHTPYLEQSNKESGFELVNVGGVHIEPFGVYSKKIKDINDLPNGAKVAIPKDVTNFSRALLLFASNGIIELDSSKDGDYTLKDITKNEKNIEFIGVDGPLLNRSLDDVDAAAINTNYALEGGLNPTEDALIIEGKDSPYVNIVVTHKDRANDENIKKVVKWLTSDKAKEFIESKYEGAVVPAF
ncbi:MetQ/NlpA family ABC transporter substrate-binding protein [Caldifermentibacillus hisashii]|uniref:MetQ/NlpA family ABC transporter substrate-binding protein n=1 Tax=Caldifermentibacillus hisashii TaxID=996558 RepID=UPI0022B96C90|nr:MetQ/NlpA family ABC transporter substrate-binding protein [Caldifermentibacillus hisashii]